MDVTCPTGNCNILLNSKCVFYEGVALAILGINTNDSVQVALQKINEVIASLETGGGEAIWGSITGTLSNQTDLQAALDTKLSSEDIEGLYWKTSGTTELGNDVLITIPTGKWLDIQAGLTYINMEPGQIYMQHIQPSTNSYYVFTVASEFRLSATRPGGKNAWVDITDPDVIWLHTSSSGQIKIESGGVLINDKPVIAVTTPTSSEDGQSIRWDNDEEAWEYYTPSGGGGSGTVTSVAISVPTGFSVSGSPITESGTLAVSYSSGYQGYTSVEASKLSGIEAGADVTDATNVASAGAIMDGDFSGNGIMVRSGSGTYTSRTITAGTGIGISNGNGVSGNPTISLSHLGIEALSDPDGDRIMFWDDSEGALKWLSIGTNLSISGNTINAFDGVTASTAELNYTVGVTSNIQDQLDAKGVGDMLLASAQTSTGKKTFQADATNAGINIGTYAGNPSGNVNGDIWYNSSINALRATVSGAGRYVPFTSSINATRIPFFTGSAGQLNTSDGLTFAGNLLTASNLTSAGTVTFSNIAAASSETYMVTVDDTGVLSSQELPDLSSALLNGEQNDITANTYFIYESGTDSIAIELDSAESLRLRIGANTETEAASIGFFPNSALTIDSDWGITLSGELTLSDVAAPTGETYMLTIDDSGVVGSQAISGGGGITNGASENELMKSDGTNAVSSGLFVNSSGALGIGTDFGTSGQVLVSNGDSASPSWETPINNGGAGIPSVVSSTNTSAATANLEHYQQVGDVVYVSGRLTLTPTSSGVVTVQLTRSIGGTIYSNVVNGICVSEYGDAGYVLIHSGHTNVELTFTASTSGGSTLVWYNYTFRIFS